MLSNPYFIGVAPGFKYDRQKPLRAQLQLAGLNSGNLLFTEALHRVLAGPSPHWGFDFDPSAVRDQHDVIVVAAANWLSPRTDWGRLSVLLDAAQLPIVVIGLGAQAPRETVMPTLSGGTQRFVDLLIDRNAHVGVRGAYSELVSHHFGMKNVVVTGCPSILWHVTRPISLKPSSMSTSRKALNTSRGLPDERLFQSKTETARLNLLLSRLALQNDYGFIGQAEFPDMYYALNRGNEDPYRKDFPDYLARIYGEELVSVERYLSRRMKVFFNVADWVDYIQCNVDMVIGSRLHGAIASLLAGVPAVLITHDTRTREAATKLDIPSIPSDLITDTLSLKHLAELVDCERVNGTMASLYADFAVFFEQCRLNHRLVNIKSDI